MSEPQVMTHPSDEIVAAFLDGQLDGEERQHVLDHTSECDACYSLTSAVWDYQAETKVVRPQFGRRIAVAAASLAAAAALVVVVFLPAFRDRRAMDAMVEASQNLKHRPVDGRLSGAFAYHEPVRVTRGATEQPQPVDEGEDDPAELKMQIAALEALDTTHDLHLAGVAHLILGQRDEAIEKLTEAAKRKPRDVAILNDLATAHYERSRYGGGEGHLKKAREIADRAWSIEQTPLTAWARAQAWDTVEAWNQYLALDSTSPWAGEARKNLEYLKP